MKITVVMTNFPETKLSLVTSHEVKGNMQRFRGGLVFKAHRLVYHSTLGVRVIKKKKKGNEANGVAVGVR